ncbi:class I SAM-dependent methyltransferase [Sphingomonas oligophenolica]|uniref:Methyltransferase domain-containing protein n=1 Tax=Sphingomonas oligophenolica TaxID=301154 RepID=A0ABU9Y6J5_9SPHN
MPIWHAIGRQLEHPRGAWGRITGAAMRLANGRPNALAIEALDIEPDHVVLDLGCGPGATVAAMARRAPLGVVHGLDQSATMIAQAARANRRALRSGHVCLARARFERLPYRDGGIDRILASNVIYFWRDVGAVVAEMRRVLRPGGRIVIYATDAAAMKRWKFAGPDTHRLFDAASLAAALGSGGFDERDIAVRGVRISGAINGLIAVVSAGAAR